MSNTIIVTRHPHLVALLIERGLATEHTRVIEHARAEDVRGRHVIGVLPHHLSSQALTITEIPMRLTRADREAMQRGDLSLERLREVAGKSVTYVVGRAGRHEDSIGRCVARAFAAATALDGHASWRVAPPEDGLPLRLQISDSSEQNIAEVDLWRPRWRHGPSLTRIGRWQNEHGELAG